MNIDKIIDEFEFPFKYEGGGYFRMKGIPKYTPAKILHGEEVLQEYENMLKDFIAAKQTEEHFKSS